MAIHYIEHYGFVDDGHSLAHYGVPGMRWRRHKYTGSSSRDYDYGVDNTIHRGAAYQREREIANRQRNAIRNAGRRKRRSEVEDHEAAARRQIFDRVQDRNRAQREREQVRKIFQDDQNSSSIDNTIHRGAAYQREREIANRQRNAIRNAGRRKRRSEVEDHEAAARRQLFDRVNDRNRTRRERDRARKRLLG